MGLYSNTKRITRAFCYAILGITLVVLTLRLTAFRDMAVIDEGSAGEPSSGSASPASGDEISGGSDFPYTFNGRIYFPSSTEQGNVLVENPDGNTYYLSVDIVDNETMRSLYYTGALEPGAAIDYDKLSLDGQRLPDGVYEATANVAALSPNDFQTVQSDRMPVTIYIGERPR
ncbi:MAG: hypothetical protein FWG94_03140 [Oscillospiraceae bacterium]|nr:hypothetical protein [Oscillospiraceae bacterium]